MKNIIKKAIEGGWETTEQPMRSWSEAKALAVIDPLFFQALGKACGWKLGQGYLSHALGLEYGEKLELNYAIRFHKLNLTEGFDSAVEWLEEQVK